MNKNKGKTALGEVKGRVISVCPLNRELIIGETALPFEVRIQYRNELAQVILPLYLLHAAGYARFKACIQYNGNMITGYKFGLAANPLFKANWALRAKVTTSDGQETFYDWWKFRDIEAQVGALLARKLEEFDWLEPLIRRKTKVGKVEPGQVKNKALAPSETLNGTAGKGKAKSAQTKNSNYVQGEQADDDDFNLVVSKSKVEQQRLKIPYVQYCIIKTVLSGKTKSLHLGENESIIPSDIDESQYSTLLTVVNQQSMQGLTGWPTQSKPCSTAQCVNVPESSTRADSRAGLATTGNVDDGDLQERMRLGQCEPASADAKNALHMSILSPGPLNSSGFKIAKLSDRGDLARCAHAAQGASNLLVEQRPWQQHQQKQQQQQQQQPQQQQRQQQPMYTSSPLGSSPFQIIKLDEPDNSTNASQQYGDLIQQQQQWYLQQQQQQQQEQQQQQQYQDQQQQQQQYPQQKQGYQQQQQQEEQQQKGFIENVSCHSIDPGRTKTDSDVSCTLGKQANHVAYNCMYFTNEVQSSQENLEQSNGIDRQLQPAEQTHHKNSSSNFTNSIQKAVLIYMQGQGNDVDISNIESLSEPQSDVACSQLVQSCMANGLLLAQVLYPEHIYTLENAESRFSVITYSPDFCSTYLPRLKSRFIRTCTQQALVLGGQPCSIRFKFEKGYGYELSFVHTTAVKPLDLLVVVCKSNQLYLSLVRSAVHKDLIADQFEAQGGWVCNWRVPQNCVLEVDSQCSEYEAEFDHGEGLETFVCDGGGGGVEQWQSFGQFAAEQFSPRGIVTLGKRKAQLQPHYQPSNVAYPTPPAPFSSLTKPPKPFHHQPTITTPTHTPAHLNHAPPQPPSPPEDGDYQALLQQQEQELAHLLMPNGRPVLDIETSRVQKNTLPTTPIKRAPQPQAARQSPPICIKSRPIPQPGSQALGEADNCAVWPNHISPQHCYAQDDSATRMHRPPQYPGTDGQSSIARYEQDTGLQQTRDPLLVQPQNSQALRTHVGPHTGEACRGSGSSSGSHIGYVNKYGEWTFVWPQQMSQRQSPASHQLRVGSNAKAGGRMGDQCTTKSPRLKKWQSQYSQYLYQLQQGEQQSFREIRKLLMQQKQQKQKQQVLQNQQQQLQLERKQHLHWLQQQQQALQENKQYQSQPAPKSDLQDKYLKAFSQSTGDMVVHVTHASNTTQILYATYLLKRALPSEGPGSFQQRIKHVGGRPTWFVFEHSVVTVRHALSFTQAVLWGKEAVRGSIIMDLLSRGWVDVGVEAIKKLDMHGAVREFDAMLCCALGSTVTNHGFGCIRTFVLERVAHWLLQLYDQWYWRSTVQEGSLLHGYCTVLNDLFVKKTTADELALFLALVLHSASQKWGLPHATEVLKEHVLSDPRESHDCWVRLVRRCNKVEHCFLYMRVEMLRFSAAHGLL